MKPPLLFWVSDLKKADAFLDLGDPYGDWPSGSQAIAGTQAFLLVALLKRVPLFTYARIFCVSSEPPPFLVGSERLD